MTLHRTGCALLIVVVASFPLIAGATSQTPARDLPAPNQTGTAVLAGLVTTAEDTPRPVRLAVLTLSGTGLRDPVLGATDDTGHFTFAHLPAGRFTVSAIKNGFVRQYYGSTRPGIAGGIPVVLSAGQRGDVTIRMTRSSAISGTLLLPPGLPASAMRLHLLRTVVVRGERRLESAVGGAFVVDDTGAFRIYGLVPGEYQLLGMAFGSPELRLSAPETTLGRTVTYSPVYFPGTTNAAGAATIRLDPGEERSGIDLPVTLVPSARIRGQVLMPDGLPASAFQINPVDESAPVPRSLQVRPEADGHFSIAGVTPGQYLLIGRAAAQGTPATALSASGGGHLDAPIELPLWAMERVDVSGQDLENVVLRLRPGLKVSGRIAVDASGPAPDLTRVRIGLQAAPGASWAAPYVPPVEATADGRFVIPNVPPGRYRVTTTILADPRVASAWAARSAVVGGQDVLDDALDVSADAGVADAVITLTDRPTEFSGRMLDSASRPVTEFALLVYSTESRFWLPLSRRVVQTKPGSDGTFAIRNLPAGKYYVCGLSEIDPSRLADPHFPEQLVPTSFTITLAEGESKRQDVKIGG